MIGFLCGRKEVKYSLFFARGTPRLESGVLLTLVILMIYPMISHVIIIFVVVILMIYEMISRVFIIFVVVIIFIKVITDYWAWCAHDDDDRLSHHYLTVVSNMVLGEDV